MIDHPCIYDAGDLKIFLAAQRSIDVIVRGNGVNIRSSVAHQIAYWILENVPESPRRDREADMRKLAEGVLNYIVDHPMCGIKAAVWMAYKRDPKAVEPINGDKIATFKLLGIEPLTEDKSGRYTSEQFQYVASLIDNLPQWIRDRALGIGGE